MERRFYLFFAIFITVIIGWGSLITIVDAIPANLSVSDKVVHVNAYFLLILSWLITYKNNSKSHKTRLFIVFLVFLYGIIIEVLQATITTNRQFEIKDILANMFGIAVGFAVFKMLLQKKFLK